MIDFLNNSLQITSYSCSGTKYFPIFQTAKFFIRVIQIAVPFALIIWGSIDWFKALIAHDEKEMRMKRKPFLKRVIFAMLIFILPWLVELLSEAIAGKTDSNNFWKCYSEAKAKIDLRKNTFSDGGQKSCADFSLDKCPKEDDYGLLCYADTKVTKQCMLLDTYEKQKGESKKDPVISQQGTVRGRGGAGSGSGSSPGGGSFGSADGSKVITYNGTKYVVIDTKYPGGVEGYQKMIKKNGVYQSYLKNNVSDVKKAGSCCGGISQVQACGLKKGMEISTSNVEKGNNSKGESKCNSSNISGCSGSWSSGKCFDDESSFVKYVIENVQKGNPVIINVGANKKKSKTTRHFLTVVGFKDGSNGTSYEDFLILDSYMGYLKPITSTSRTINGKGVTILNHPCNSNTKNYASVITK